MQRNRNDENGFHRLCGQPQDKSKWRRHFQHNKTHWLGRLNPFCQLQLVCVCGRVKKKLNLYG